MSIKNLLNTVSCLGCVSKLSYFIPAKFRKSSCSTRCSDSELSCSKNKFCICKFSIKVALAIVILFVSNTYLGFSNKAMERYIMNHPRVITESVEQMFKNEKENKVKENEESAQKEYNNIIKNGKLPFVGNKDGSKIIIEFFDYNCGYCKKAHGEVSKAIKMDPQLKVIFINSPIMSEASLVAAKANIAIFNVAPEYFEDFHHRLMNHNSQLSPADVQNIIKISTKNKFNYVQDAMSGKKIEDEISENYELMKKIGIQGTPAFIINKKLVPGFVTSTEMLKYFN